MSAHGWSAWDLRLTASDLPEGPDEERDPCEAPVRPTPGPWRVERSGVLDIMGADGRHIAGAGDAGEAQDEADARLLAAASELAECLRDHVRYFDCGHSALEYSCCSCEAKRLLRFVQVAP